MTRDEIISMAREASIEPTNFKECWDARTSDLVDFAALAATEVKP